MVKSTSLQTASLVLLTCLAVGGCDLFTSPDQYSDRAAALLARGEYSAAMVQLKNAQVDGKSNGRVSLLVAQTSLMLGDLDGASKELERAVNAGAPALDTDSLRARLWLKRAQFQQLITALDAGTLAAGEYELRSLRAQAIAGLRRCQEAIPLAREQLLRNPRDAALRVVVAECYAQHRNAPRALRELQDGTAADPDAASLWLARGRIERLLGDAMQAQQSWQQSARHAAGQLDIPQQLMLYSALADLQVEHGNLDDMRHTAQQLLLIAPQAPITALVGARLALAEGRLSEGVDTLRKLTTASPDLPTAYVLLASGYIAQGNNEQALMAIGWLEQHSQDPAQVAPVRKLLVLPKVPVDSEEFALRAAAAQISLGQLDLARYALEKTAGGAARSTRVTMMLARLEMRAGHAEAALRMVEPIAKVATQDDAVTFLYSETLAAADRYADAARVLESVSARQPSASLALALFRLRQKGGLASPFEPLERWLASNPGDLAVRAHYAEALREAGDNRHAAEQYAVIVAAAPDKVAALNNLAWLYYLEGDARALPLARRAWEQAPKDPSVLDTYGWLQVESGAVEEGLVHLQAADAAAGVAQPEVHLHYLAALSRAGDAGRARELLTSFMAEGPAFENQPEASRLLASIRESAST